MSADAEHLATSQHARDAHSRRAGGDLLPADHDLSGTQPSVVRGHHLPTDHGSIVAHPAPVGGHHLATSYSSPDTHGCVAGGDLLPTDHCPTDTQRLVVGGHLLQPVHSSTDRPVPVHTSGGWLELRLAAELFDRAQLERIAVSNLIRRPQDGGNIDPVFFVEHLARLEVTEHQARLMMRRTYRRVVPAELRAWQQQAKGVGDDLFARLLGHLGDPYIATPHYWDGSGSARVLMVEQPRVRTIAQLWQYAGHGAPARRVRGMSADDLAAQGNPMLKMLVHLNAKACMKQTAGSHYRDVYTTTREAVAEKLHSATCVRCGPSGRPAEAGSPWSPGHQHAHALRIVGKELLRDMWLTRHHAATGGAS